MNLCPFQILEHGCPVILTSDPQKWLFVLLPALSAAFGAFVGQGSWLRIVTAAFFGGLRDASLLLVIAAGFLVPTNPSYSADCGMILAFGCASGAALLATLSPYRGKFLILMSAFGAFAGQYLLLLVMGSRQKKQTYKVAASL